MWEHLLKQVEFGSRVPGSEAHAQCLDYMEAHLKKYAENVARQSFQHTIEKSGDNVQLTNLIASFNSSQTQRILLAAHWDSRPWADSDTNPENYKKPVPGANDGASGVAILLEIAKVLKENPPPVGVDIILFDGEDFGSNGIESSWAVGSQYFAKNKDARYSPYIGLLLDMVGEKGVQIKKEGHSMNFAPDVVNVVWNYASRLGVDAFSSERTGPITDDHLPLLRAGIRCINLIDLDYPQHHTLQDTPDKCSPESLEQIAKVALAVVYNPPE